MSNNDYPFYEAAREAQALMEDGHTIFQKFTCGGCGSRQTMGQPNKFFIKGQCEECGAETDIEARGCNYMVVCSIAALH
jgi:ribosomal protein S27E